MVHESDGFQGKPAKKTKGYVGKHRKGTIRIGNPPKATDKKDGKK